MRTATVIAAILASCVTQAQIASAVPLGQTSNEWPHGRTLDEEGQHSHLERRLDLEVQELAPRSVEAAIWFGGIVSCISVGCVVHQHWWAAQDRKKNALKDEILTCVLNEYNENAKRNGAKPVGKPEADEDIEKALGANDGVQGKGGSGSIKSCPPN